MSNRRRYISYLFLSLFAGEVVGIIISIIFSFILFFLYNNNFKEISFINLFIYFVGNLAFFTIIISLVFSIFVYVFRKIIKKVFKNIEFAFFLSFIFSFHFIVWVVLYINSNFLRYSREFKSYIIDIAIVMLGIVILFVLYKIIPSIKSIENNIYFRIPVLLLLMLFLIFLLKSNPFSIDYYVSKKNIQHERNYDSQGNPLAQAVFIDQKDLNVVLLSIDTLRADGLSCYGNPSETSYNIDLLSKEGILFEHVLSQSSWTLPSHMTIFTSLFPSVHGCIISPMWSKFIDKLDDYWITLPEVLKSYGYYTVAFTDGALLGPTYNFNQGFDICDDSGGGIEKISQKAIQWLQNYSYEDPFFLFLHCYDVHRYRPPEELENMFTKKYSGKLKKYRNLGNSLEERITSNAFYDLSADDINYLKSLYNAEIYLTDREFGRILNYLKNNNLYENTIIIVTSDHGEEFWEHKGTGHGWTLHQHQLKVPLIIKSPTLSQSRKKINEWVGLIDIAPTILDMLGIPIPSDFQGISLIPLVRKKSYNKRIFIAEASHLGNQKNIIYEGYSFLFNKFPPLGEKLFDWRSLIYVWRSIMNSSGNELYNLGEDTYEYKNIIWRDPKLASKMKYMLLNELKNNLTLNLKGKNIPRKKMNKKAEENLRSLGYIK